MDDLFIRPRLVVPSGCLSFHAVRASGPGGQNVNKVATKVDLRFDLARCDALSDATKARLSALATLDAQGRVIVQSDATRSQAQNLEDARAKLAELIRRALVVPRARRPTKPTKGSARRRMDEKSRQGEKKRARGRVRGDD